VNVSDFIALGALLVSVLSVFFTVREGRKQRAERVDDQVRAVVHSELRHIELGINSATFAFEFEPWDPEWEGPTSDLRALAPRMRRVKDRQATEQVAGDRDIVRARWWDTKQAFEQWHEQWESEAMGQVVPADGRMSTEDLFTRFNDARQAYIPKAERLRADIHAIVARIDARYR
jgi:hypothetical protein